MITKVTAVLAMFLTAASVFAASGDDILGVWNNQEKDARIEIFECGDKYCGKIISLNEPNYPAGSKEGVSGTPKLDHHNPEEGRHGIRPQERQDLQRQDDAGVADPAEPSGFHRHFAHRQNSDLDEMT